MRIEEKVLSEHFDVFQVEQLTRSTVLEDSVAVDVVRIGPDQTSEIHQHNKAETILYIVSGAGEVSVGNRVYSVMSGDRIHIPAGSFHGVRTHGEALHFISIQTPPILNKKTGVLDLEKKI